MDHKTVFEKVLIAAEAPLETSHGKQLNQRAFAIVTALEQVFGPSDDNAMRPFRVDVATVVNREAFSEIAKGQFSKRLSELALDYSRRLKIDSIELLVADGGLGARVQALYDYAARIDTDLIVAPTHGKKGLELLKQGSFVEKLVLHSDIPVLTVGPGVSGARPSRVQPFKRILFPTDFRGRSKRILERVMAFASNAQAQITVLHVAPIRPSDDVPLRGPSPAPFELGQRPPAWRDYHEESRLAAEAFTDHIRVNGLKGDALFDFSGQNLLHVIQAVAGEFDLLALGTRAGPVSTLFSGMITHRLLAEVSCPVWLLHENPRAGVREWETGAMARKIS